MEFNENETVRNFESAKMHDFEIEALNEVSKEKHFNTEFRFLSAHNGLRREKLHVFAAPSSSGKSTMAKTILYDFLINNPDDKVGVFLTEESEQEFKIDLAKTGLEEAQLDRTFVTSEEDQGNVRNADDLMRSIHVFMDEVKPDVLILDNITTSAAYQDIPTAAQGAIVKRLKMCARHHNSALLVFAHTNAEASNMKMRLLEPNDVRGSKHIVNHAHFFYCLQQIHCKTATGLSNTYSFVRIHKHRGQVVEMKMFMFKFDREKLVYSSDCFINFDDLKQVFERREGL
jgi:KaiC/GvpD/RAD55 family RecA-like ATPase